MILCLEVYYQSRVILHVEKSNRKSTIGRENERGTQSIRPYWVIFNFQDYSMLLETRLLTCAWKHSSNFNADRKDEQNSDNHCNAYYYWGNQRSVAAKLLTHVVTFLVKVIVMFHRTIIEQPSRRNADRCSCLSNIYIVKINGNRLIIKTVFLNIQSSDKREMKKCYKITKAKFILHIGHL